jgi:hypothetical protein
VWETNRDDHTTYLSTASRIQLEHDNYWDWSANPHKDILTLQYLESKLTDFVKPDIVVHGHNPADTENYWETTSAKDKESQTIHSHGSSLMNYTGPDDCLHFAGGGNSSNVYFRGHREAIEILCVRSILGGYSLDGEFRGKC